MRQMMVYLFLTMFISAAAGAHLQSTRPIEDFTPGFLCTPQDPGFLKFDYPEQIARCARHVDKREKLLVAKNYGNIPDSEWSNFEFDHLIPLCAGGSNDPRNIWPQPLDQAKGKDALEDRICQLMKKGKMSQSEAVQQVSEWFLEHSQAM